MVANNANVCELVFASATIGANFYDYQIKNECSVYSTTRNGGQWIEKPVLWQKTKLSVQSYLWTSLCDSTLISW